MRIIPLTEWYNVTNIAAKNQISKEQNGGECAKDNNNEFSIRRPAVDPVGKIYLTSFVQR